VQTAARGSAADSRRATTWIGSVCIVIVSTSHVTHTDLWQMLLIPYIAPAPGFGKGGNGEIDPLRRWMISGVSHILVSNDHSTRTCSDNSDLGPCEGGQHPGRSTSTSTLRCTTMLLFPMLSNSVDRSTRRTRADWTPSG
jgi:hypothetical protein